MLVAVTGLVAATGVSHTGHDTQWPTKEDKTLVSMVMKGARP